MLTSSLKTARRAFQLTVLLSLLGLAAVSSSRGAVTVEPDNVVPNDKFSLSIIGYNTNYQSQAIFLTSTTLIPTFGVTNTYTGAGLNNQTVTVNSIEYTNSGFTYDYINVSVPNNFVPVGTTDAGGHPIDAFMFGLGNVLAIQNNPLDFNQALTNYTVSGTLTFIFNGTNASIAVPMTTTLTNGNRSLTTVGTDFASPQGTGSIANNQINSFSILVTYAVPEPSTYAMLGLGLGGLFLVVRRRRHARL